MHGVLVRPPWSVDSSTLLEVPPTERIRFGRGGPGLGVDLVLTHPAVSRLAGEITASSSCWYLTNLSGHATYLVANPEGAGEHIRVGPGRAGVPIPFEISDLCLPTDGEPLTLQVFSPGQPVYVGVADTQVQGGTSTMTSFPLDRGARYFLVLVALCEPRLRGDGFAALPTTSQVSRRLGGSGGGEALTPRAVDFHIDYLARSKFRLRYGCGTGGGLGERREAVASFALRFGLVCEDDLGLLPPLRSQVAPRQAPVSGAAPDGARGPR